MRQLSRWILSIVMLLSLSACSTISGWFDSDDDDPTLPVELVKFDQTVKVRKLWSAGVGDGQGVRVPTRRSGRVD